jgi:formylglycine-generating enzyme required for sulfatase activity
MRAPRIHLVPTWRHQTRLVPATRAYACGLTLLGFTVLGCGGGNEPSIAPAPSASFSYSPATPVVGQPVQFSDLSTGSPTSWSWDFGDGSTSASRDPSHSYVRAGSFAVTLTVANASGSNRTSQTLTCRTSFVTAEVRLPGDQYDMGDHFGFVDLSHPSDELPIHKVRIDPFFIAINDTTNAQFLAYLNDAISRRLIEVRGGVVYGAGTSDVYYYTHDYASSYSINFNGTAFSIVDFRANHPVVGVMWSGAAAYCNWLSAQNGLEPCYNTATRAGDFKKNGYRLPTEAEWEYAARGGQYNPYFNYPWGNTPDVTKANWPDSRDPYEGVDTSTHPWTTPVGFYNGQLRLKSDFNWPGAVTSYQTSNGANGFGLYDMAGNVWQFVNDWYGQNYYGISPYDNPKGPDAGSPMPDGLPYRNMRGGNWYNGDMVSGVNDGHSRVSNRDPSYYRGPLELKQSWNGVGFRVARNDGPVLNTAGTTDNFEGIR